MKPIQLAIIAIAVLLAGCSPRATITVATAKAAFDAEMTPTAEKTVRRFTGAEAELFDRTEISASLSKAGMTVDRIDFPKPSALSVRTSVANLDGLFEGAVTYARGGRKMTVTISRETIHAAANSMSAGMRDYVELLMAPAFTGETLSEAEYLDVIRAAYGNSLGDELEKSRFTLTVECPSSVTSARIDAPASCTSVGKQAVFQIPLAALLAMERPFSALAEW